MKRNKEQERDMRIAYGILAGFLLLMFFCYIFCTNTMCLLYVFLSLPIWFFVSGYFYSRSEDWTWEQIKEQKSKEKFVPPEAIVKEENEGLENRKS